MHFYNAADFFSNGGSRCCSGVPIATTTASKIKGVSSVGRIAAGVGCFMACLILFGGSALAQSGDFSQSLVISAKSVATWNSQGCNIVQAEGSVKIDSDHVKMSAQRAVVWLSKIDGPAEQTDVQIVLLGDAEVIDNSPDNRITRSGPKLVVRLRAGSAIRITSDGPDKNISRDLSKSDVYQQADQLRQQAQPTLADDLPATVPAMEPTTAATTQPGEVGSVQISQAGGKGFIIEPQFDNATSRILNDGTEAFVLSGKVALTRQGDDGSFLELQADHMVVFTTYKPDESKDQASAGIADKQVRDKIKSVYLEGDVRINETSANKSKPEDRLTADRAFYELETNRAVLTNVVMHTVDGKQNIPIIFRAEKARQLANGEFATEHVEMTDSQFAVPTYSVKASYAYIREESQPEGGWLAHFISNDDTFRIEGIPFFYWPQFAGDISSDPSALRNANVGYSTRDGWYAATQWGLWETLGLKRPKDIDAQFRVDYLDKRGPAVGLDAQYAGGLVDESSGQPWTFIGDLHSYLIDDRGVDQLGGSRTNVKAPQDIRGYAVWDHEQFLPNDWQVQIRLGTVLDPTFREEFTQDWFDNGMPYDAEFYAKRQRDSEAITFLAETDTTTFITNADRQQEQTDIQRLPEVEYQRIGDSLLDDKLTFFSDNSAARLRFQDTHASLAEQGFGPGLSPGIPSDGLTGTMTTPVWREDTSQELDMPLTLGQIKIVPYALARLTEYSEGPGTGNQTRLYGGVGARMSTAFWAVNDSAESDLLDIHRLRHIVEPEINLFTSGTTVDRGDLYDFDPNIDGINDISALQLALHQRWETMRGGPGGWRSADLFDLDVAGNFFLNQPPSIDLNPSKFRSIFFPSEVQTSVPRQGINVDATWHVSDTTAAISEVDWNLDHSYLALASIGLAVQRSDKLSYFLGDSYVGPLNSQIATFILNYQLTPKYMVSIGQNIDLGSSHSSTTSLNLTRTFDTVSVSVSVYHDTISKTNGFNFNIVPLGTPPSNGLGNLFNH
jgi:hypothetical protein